ncbi:hypothetical protein LJC16_00450 [Bacteroidales bacterium OttesenSCG-928-C19]|nr:hypothetical protein [Bacteroidales bacterium OttesenSCG-928-C19]
MKKQDLIFIGCVILFFLPFFTIDSVYAWYKAFNSEHGMIMSFFKFATLSTTGEVIGLRISQGVYSKKGFGILPRALVWGILGMGITMAMKIFSAGTPAFIEYLGLEGAKTVLGEALSVKKVLVAFCISVSMNCIFAPVFMTLHKITDTHIMNNGGTMKGFFTPIKFSQILKNLNWEVQWKFVFMKTIPFFWFPAHTITFLLPSDLQVLFAALLGVALGILLSLANLKKK